MWFTPPRPLNRDIKPSLPRWQHTERSRRTTPGDAAALENPPDRQGLSLSQKASQ
jgi:hypothetical protein